MVSSTASKVPDTVPPVTAMSSSVKPVTASLKAKVKLTVPPAMFAVPGSSSLIVRVGGISSRSLTATVTACSVRPPSASVATTVKA